MENRHSTISGKLLERHGIENFIVSLATWNKDGLSILFGYVWTGLDNLYNELSEINLSKEDMQMERDITEHLFAQIEEILRIFDTPLRIIHSGNEMSGHKNRKAKPLEYDLAFYMRGCIEIKFPLEAKLLKYKDQKKKSIDLSDYIDSIQNRFLTGKYSPYSSHASMVGYLLDKENIPNILNTISEKLNTPMIEFTNFTERNHKYTEHKRDNQLSKEFYCHHIIYQFC